MTDELLGVVASNLRWFECDGSVIAIDRSKSAALAELPVAKDDEHAVADLIDAVLLNEQDPLLRCIDDWCNNSFNWRPWRQASSDPESDLANRQASEIPVLLHELTGFPRLGLSLTSLQGTPRAVLLAIDAETLNQMPPLPEAWQSLVELRVFLRQGCLCLQTMQLNSQERDKLAPGSLMLLPQSFEPVWQVKVTDMATDVPIFPDGIAGEVDVEQNRIRLLPCHDKPIKTTFATVPGEHMLNESAHNTLDSTADMTSDLDVADVDPAGSPRTLMSVTVELKESLPFNALYTRSVWQAQRNMVLSLPCTLDGAPVALWQNGGNRSEKDIVRLSGQLLRVGQGFGVLLEDDGS